MMGRRLSLGVVAVAAALGAAVVPANASQVAVFWYSIDPSTPDFNLTPCGNTQDCGQDFNTSNPEVQSTMSTGNPVPLGFLPVSAGNSNAGLAETAGSPLQWWPASALEGHTIVNLPLGQNMFVPEGTGSSDASAFQTAIIFGVVHVGAGGGSITFGGDDDMFLALSDSNGHGMSIVDQLGGVHPFGTTETYNITMPGNYVMEAFYADRHVVAAYADLEVTGPDISVTQLSAVPEPSTWAMMLVGFAGLGYAAYRRGGKSRLDGALA
jgi:hypothetical protein